MEEKFRKYIILWLSQSVSGLGSSMTGFALILWAYGQSHSAMSVSLMSFCNYVPYVFLSLFIGDFIDRHKKKTIMLVSDSIAAAGSLAVLAFLLAGHLAVRHIYAINVVIGITNAFQQPASAVATGRLVPKEKISNASGMNSFSNNLTVVFSPMLVAFLFAAGGLSLILLIDLVSFVFAFCVLLFFITIPEQPTKEIHSSPFTGMAEGFAFLKKESRHKAVSIYASAAISFLFGDLMMAIGKNVLGWSAAAIAAGLPIPFIMANQDTILYRKIPATMQGRVFAVRNAIQYSTIPVGIILGGYLADYVFEPFMSSGNRLARILEIIVGNSAGSGMAVMFLCTGICGFTVSMAACFNREIKKLN